MHVLPAVQGWHAPLSQTRLEPHPVPFGSVPFWVQVGTPVEHPVIIPVSQGAGVHVAPSLHVMQLPSSHTAFVPHDVPLLTGFMVSVQEGPPLHESVPMWHTFDGVHDPPAAHMTQLPPLQTSFVPQEVPSSTSSFVSVHTGTPVEQSVEPTWQGLLGKHAAPSVHALHDPSSHTSSFPQLVPLATLFIVSVHTTPVEQERVPV